MLQRNVSRETNQRCVEGDSIRERILSNLDEASLQARADRLDLNVTIFLHECYHLLHIEVDLIHKGTHFFATYRHTVEANTNKVF